MIQYMLRSLQFLESVCGRHSVESVARASFPGRSHIQSLITCSMQAISQTGGGNGYASDERLEMGIMGPDLEQG